MNPDIPQEVRIVNAIAEQLFDVWPVSIVMIDLLRDFFKVITKQPAGNVFDVFP